MPNKPKHKMSIENRAKQFMPFSALRGLHQALVEKEHIKVPKIELTEEKLEELDIKLKELSLGSLISVTYYEQGEYIKVSGVLAKINTTSRILQIVSKKISFENIVSIDDIARNQF